eukprot:06145.XXX_65717_65887_1 [CDS] Oithona nana genome sequencing.
MNHRERQVAQQWRLKVCHRTRHRREMEALPIRSHFTPEVRADCLEKTGFPEKIILR